MSDHQHFLAQTAVTPAGGHSRVSKKKSFRKICSKPGRSRQNALRWPDLSCYDLSDPIDIHNCHQLLAAIGAIRDDYAGLEHVALAALMAHRLADRNPHGYFARILRNGFTHLGPADKDFAAAKRILRELAEW